MFVEWKLWQSLRVLAGLLSVVGLTGCAHVPRVANSSETSALRDALISLDPAVQAEEAARVASCAYDYSRTLALRYRVVRPALLQNFLVNSGFRDRGLCFQWAEDLLAQLQTLQLQSVELHWAIARADTFREHNSVVVTARGQPFGQGIVLDPWRRCGDLVWSAVATDRYPWVEGELTNSPVATTP